MEFEGEEFSVFEEYKPPVETIDPIEEEETIENESNKRPLKEFADEQNLKMPTLRKIIYLLTEQGIIFERTVSAILVDPFQEKTSSWNPRSIWRGRTQVLSKSSWRTIVHHELGQGQGKPDRRSGADRSPKFLGHDETSTPVF